MDQNYQNTENPNRNYRPEEQLPNAVIILVLGILSIVFCQPLGIAALIMGNQSMALYRQEPNRYSESSYNMVKAGRICGIIGICLIIGIVLLMLAGVSIFSFFAF
jgi:hypothetical protein